ncbi:MAG: glycosyltransferase, partial [Geminicoccaceae bacterium]
APGRTSGPDGSDPAHPVQLLGVARLVAKKGVDTLLEALQRLPADLHWRYVHIGGGVEKDQIKARATELGLADRIDWQGAKAQEAVIAAYRNADLYVMASRIAADGDRDGLPNVLMEAGSQELAAVTTAVSAVPELIADGENGLLVPPDDASALATALEALIRDPKRRLSMGRQARRIVVDRFGMDPGLDQLAARLRNDIETVPSKAA